MIPRRRPRKRMCLKQPNVVRCPAHLQFVRGFDCSIKGLNGHVCDGKVEAAHVRTGTDGGMSMKPSDCYTIPLCHYAHSEQHRIGEDAFEKEYGISMRGIADKLAARSAALSRYYRERNRDGRITETL